VGSKGKVDRKQGIKEGKRKKRRDCRRARRSGYLARLPLEMSEKKTGRSYPYQTGPKHGGRVKKGDEKVLAEI